MKSIITIGREYGSGGKEIGETLGKLLDIPVYDKTVISMASKKSGIHEDLFYQNDETQQGSFIFSLLMGNYVKGENGVVNPQLPLNNNIFLAQFDTIRELAAKGAGIFIGRCADYVLRDNPDLFTIFITSNYEDRIKRVKQRMQLDDDKAAELIKKTDKKRSNYYAYYAEKKWGVASNYDLCINSSLAGIEGTAQLIADFCKKI